MINWDAIGAVGEIIGAVAVVGSLIYLATQIRAQIRESRIAAIRETTANLMDGYTPLQEPHLADVWTRGSKDYESLTESEKVQFIAFVNRYLLALQSAFYQASDGHLDKRLWTGIAAHVGAVISTPGVRQMWPLRKHSYSEDFRAFLESVDQDVPYEI